MSGRIGATSGHYSGNTEPGKGNRKWGNCAGHIPGQKQCPKKRSAITTTDQTDRLCHSSFRQLSHCREKLMERRKRLHVCVRREERSKTARHGV